MYRARARVNGRRGTQDCEHTGARERLCVRARACFCAQPGEGGCVGAGEAGVWMLRGTGSCACGKPIRWHPIKCRSLPPPPLILRARRCWRFELAGWEFIVKFTEPARLFFFLFLFFLSSAGRDCHSKRASLTTERRPPPPPFVPHAEVQREYTASL